MKNKLFFLLLFFSLNTFSQGINFLPISMAEGIKIAKKQHKNLFIELYSPSCHVCESFIPVFNEKTVGTYFNQNFISIKLDIDSPEFKQSFERKHTIFLFSIPLMLFYDSNENFLHHASLNMGQGVSTVLQQGQVALDVNKRSSTWKKSYLAGNRDKVFLTNYATQCRIFKDTTMNMAVMNAFFNSFPKNQLSSFNSLQLCESLVMDVDNGFFQYWINNLSLANKIGRGREKFYFENIILGSLYSSRGAKYSSEKITKINNYLAKLGYSSIEITKKTLLPMTKALLHEGKKNQAIITVNNYLKVAKPSVKEQNYWVKILKQ